MNRPSLRFKIALLSASISGVVMLGFGWVGMLVLSHQKIDSLDARIRSIGSRQPGWLSQLRDFARFEEYLGFVVGGDAQAPVLLVVWGTNGELLHRSADWPSDLDPARFKHPLADLPDDGQRSVAEANRGSGPGNPPRFTKVPDFCSVQTASGQWRIGRLGSDDMTLVIGLDERATHAEIVQLQRRFLLILPLVLALVWAGGWLVAGRALKPLHGITDTIARVTSRGLNERIAIPGKDPEIARLAEMLNGMMDRLEESFHQATRFSADASHELKTPLAIMRGELENAMNAAVPGSPEQQVFSGLLDEVQRLGSITRSLLLLSRADAGQLEPVLEPVALAELLNEVLEDTEVLAEAAEIALEVEPLPEITVVGDVVLLRTALLNLFTNAIKHNEPGGVIRVALDAYESSAVLTICNSGPGIPVADQPWIFRRFHRADRGRGRSVDGIGLGLSLAREILLAHQGKIELLESSPGRTCFKVEFTLQA